MTSLRDRLRAETAPGHDRVEDAYSTLDLRRAPDLGTFLAAQRSVLAAMRIGPGPSAGAARALAAWMAEALDADLRHLGANRDARLAEVPLHATAVRYLLLGSTLGLRVLHRRWLEGAEPAAAGAGRYLALAPAPGAWKALCEELARHPSTGAEADRIVADADRAFGLHLAALKGRVPLAEGAPHA